MYHREYNQVDKKPNEKDVGNDENGSIDIRNVIVISKKEKKLNPVENDRKIFSESSESLRSYAENNPFYDAKEEVKTISYTDNEENVTKYEATLLEKSTLRDTDAELYESEDENSKDIDEDEESVLLNGYIAKIFVTRIENCQNERTATSSENLSSKEAKYKQEEEPLQNEKTEKSSENFSSEDATSKQEKKPKKKSKKKGVLATVDALFSVVIVAPVVVSYWKCVWTLIDSHHDIFPAHVCFLLGAGVHTMFAILRHYFHDKFAKELKVESISARVGCRIVRMLYTYVFSAACIMHWRGAWLIYDDCVAAYKGFLGLMTVIGIVISILLRSVRNFIAAPYIVVIDKRGNVFRFPTRFNMNTRDWTLYILDCAFSVAVVGTLVVFVWRGVWVICDLYLFPENPEYSALGSIVIGYTIVVITFSLQPLMRYACTRLKGLPRLAVVDIFLLLSFAATVNVWRGVWNTLGLWLLPENPELSCWITHLGCFTFLVLLNCSNSILVRGVYIDAEEEEGKCAVFPCHYLRLFFKIEREKKEARRQNLIVASRDLATITERTEKEENEALMNISNSANVTQNPESLV